MKHLKNVTLSMSFTSGDVDKYRFFFYLFKIRKHVQRIEDKLNTSMQRKNTIFFTVDEKWVDVQII